MLLANRVAIITGGAKGIGKGIALKFAEEGCAVVIADIDEKIGPQTAREVTEKGSHGTFVRCDSTDEKQVQDMVAFVIKKFSKIDILVNNTGGFGVPVPIQNLSVQEWDRSVNLNMKGVFLCSKAVAPHMIEKKYGKIINISSISAIAAGPPAIHYTGPKGGVLAMTLDLALEFARTGICVNAILPGSIRTDMWNPQLPPGIKPDDFFRDLSKMVPLGRVGKTEDVAGAALFYASNLSDYITGDRILVAGGLPLSSPGF
jgi:3-oxoacyl-[acyl-carrier protein] reductase